MVSVLESGTSVLIHQLSKRRSQVSSPPGARGCVCLTISSTFLCPSETFQEHQRSSSAYQVPSNQTSLLRCSESPSPPPRPPYLSVCLCTGSLYLSVCLCTGSLYLSVCLCTGSLYLSVCLCTGSLYLSVCLCTGSLYLSVCLCTGSLYLSVCLCTGSPLSISLSVYWHCRLQTQTNVKVYDLARQELTKKLQAGLKWISSMDIHPGGKSLAHTLPGGTNSLFPLHGTPLLHSIPLGTPLLQGITSFWEGMTSVCAGSTWTSPASRIGSSGMHLSSLR